jgi:hypothetical protein
LVGTQPWTKPPRTANRRSGQWGEYLIQWVRDTLENLQSESWQLAVQFAILAGLLKWLKVEAYEEDQEEIKAELAEIKALLNERSAE